MAQTSLIIYTLDGCPTCIKATSYYKRKGIAYEEREVNSNPQWQADATVLSPNHTVPVIVEYNGNSQIITVGWEGREG